MGSSKTFKYWLIFFLLSIFITVPIIEAKAACDVYPSGTYIEAEKFSGSLNSSSGSTFSLQNSTDTNGGQYLKAGNVGSTSLPPPYEIKEYELNFTAAGTYYIWVRARGFSSSQNSFWFGLNNSGYQAWALSTDGNWSWTKALQVGTASSVSISTPGTYTINIGIREANSEVDGFYLTQGTETPTTATVPSTVTEADPTDCSTGSGTVCALNEAGTYIEAENFTGSSNTSTDTTKNFSLITSSDANGSQALKSGTSSSTSNTPTREVKEYLVNFPVDGTYYFWMRGYATGGSTDSMLYTVDNESWRVWNFDTTIYNAYTWTNSIQNGLSNGIHVTAGDHTIKIGMRERDTIIDGFYVTTGSETPTDSIVPNNVTVVDPNNCTNIGRFSLDPISLGPTNFVGYNAASDTFTITNTGTEKITDVNISTSASWLTVSPSTISELAVNESVTVTVHFSTSALAAGTQNADITVSSTTSSNSPSIAVTLLVKSVPSTAACGEVPLYAENIVNPAIMVQLDTSGSMSTAMYIMADGENPATPDLATIIQEIVNLSGWESGNSMGFVISGSGKRSAWSYDGQPNGAPKLFVTYKLSSTTEETANRVSVSAGDVQVSGTSVNTTNTYIELGKASSPVGLKFNGLEIPAGATIISAEIKFLIKAGDTTTTNLTITGINQPNISDFTYEDLTTSTNHTTASVAWNNVSSWSNTMSRIAIAEDVLKEVFLDQSIAWGFATWAGGNGSSTASDSSGDNYTRYRVGIHTHDATHQANLQAKADDGSANGYTPLAPTMQAALDYFGSLREDETYNETYADLSCQPKILVLVTDGLGNTGTTLALAKTRAQQLAAAGISVVTVGFGLDDASQIQEIAKIAQAAGHVSEDDFLYPLHDEDAAGNGLPFLAQSREDFIDAMNKIVSNVKEQLFYGSAPAPTTTVDDGDLIISSTFDASDWSGNLTATEYDNLTGTLETTPLWSAEDVMPDTSALKAYIYDSAEADFVSNYTDASLATDNYICKPLGDIINSTPVIVGSPAYNYSFNGYKAWKYSSTVYGRPSLVYVNANDGALHAFSLATGVEQWRFYPDSVKTALNLMGLDPTQDMCSSSYCHKFINDGSPQVADIYDGSSWATILTSGLGLGGQAFFALDISYGNNFDETTTNPSKYMWEFTNTDDAEIGFATSYPAITRAAQYTATGGTWSKTGATWNTYFSSGEAINDTLQASKEAYLFAVRAWDKAMVWRTDASSTAPDTYKVKLETGTLANDVAASPTIADIENVDDISDRIYLGNRYGDMFRVSDIGEGQVPVVGKLFDSTNTDHSTPITGRANYGIDGDTDHDNIYDIWIYFGTGKYEDQVDKVSTDQQYFFGLYDAEGAKSTPYVMSDLFTLTTEIVEGFAVDSDGNEIDQNGDNIYNSDDYIKVRTIDCAAADKDADGNCNAAGNSWVLQLLTPSDSGSERSFRRPLVLGGVVFFVTFIPDQDLCGGNGESYLMALDWQKGTASDDPIFDINGDGEFDSSDKVVIDAAGNTQVPTGISIGDGVPSELAVSSSGDDATITVNTAGGGTQTIPVNIKGLKSRLKAWRQVIND